MIFGNTGNFTYDSDAEDIYQVRERLEDQYEEMLSVARKYHEDVRLDRDTKNRLLKALCWSEHNIDAINEAIEPLCEDHRLAVLILFQQLIAEASAIGHANAVVHAGRLLQEAGTAHARSFRTSPGREAAIEAAIRDCPVGERKPACWVAARLDRENIRLQPDAIKKRMKKMGVWQKLREAALVSARATPSQSDNPA